MKKKVISGIGNTILIVDLYSLNVSNVSLPGPWKVGGGNTGVWIDGKGNIWVLGYGGRTSVEKVTIKPGTLIPVRLKYGLFRVYLEQGKYIPKLMGVIK